MIEGKGVKFALRVKNKRLQNDPKVREWLKKCEKEILDSLKIEDYIDCCIGFHIKNT